MALETFGWILMALGLVLCAVGRCEQLLHAAFGAEELEVGT